MLFVCTPKCPEYGNPIQQAPQQQPVMVVQQPPVQQGVPLQVANTGYTAAPVAGGGTIVGGYYVPSVAYNPDEPPPAYVPQDNQTWGNKDEVPPDYASTLEQNNQATAQDGHGCIAGCIANPHALSEWNY